MTVGQLKTVLADPRLRDDHEVFIGNRGSIAKSAIAETVIDSKPERLRVFLIVPADDFCPLAGRCSKTERDEFMEDDDE